METIDDIVRDMRIGDIRATANTSSKVERKAFEYINDFLAGYADRIEAAWEREAKAIATKAQSVTKCNQLGNVASMREALEKCMELGKSIDNSLGNDESTVWNCRYERSSANSIVAEVKGE